jgi:deoxyribodipyrimidine photo-lyase
MFYEFLTNHFDLSDKTIADIYKERWQTRPVFGSIRYMNENGCRRKFDVDRYVERWGG